MVVLFILGLACMAIAGMKYAEGLSFSLWAYLIIGIVCVVVYLVSVIKKRMEK